MVMMFLINELSILIKVLHTFPSVVGWHLLEYYAVHVRLSCGVSYPISRLWHGRWWIARIEIDVNCLTHS